MSRVVQEGCIASCVRYFLLPNRSHTWCLLRGTLFLSLLHVNPVRIRFTHLTLEENSAGFTLRKKAVPGHQHSLCKGIPNTHIESRRHCFLFGIFHSSAHTSLRMSGGAIPAIKYRSSILVGIRHTVTALHALFRFVFSFWA